MEAAVARVVKELFGVEAPVIFTRPEPAFGDFATNIALQLAKSVGKSPRVIAETVAERLRREKLFSEITVAGPGFINVRLIDTEVATRALTTTLETPVQRVLLEYSCPNPFKEVHTGHMYQTFLGDALARMYERVGSTVYRANFGGDVGLHVAKAMWGLLKELGGENPEKLDFVAEDGRAGWIAKAYVAGSQAYENDDQAKLEIATLNKKVYQLHQANDHGSPFAQIYWTCRQWSYDYFKKIYEILETHPFDKFYPESEAATPGLELVEGHLGDIFVESEGAIILPEEKTGLHTRVFINSHGLPMYEAKDLGVILLEYEDFAYDKRIIMTGNDQAEYMKVVFAALRLIDPELGAKQIHAVNGTVRFGDGKKMSSRLGNVETAMGVLAVAGNAVQAENEIIRQQIALGALKYSLLKNRMGGDIAFDLQQSVSLEGNSGPYLQYAAVRAGSILAKISTHYEAQAISDLDEYERPLAWELAQYGPAIDSALADSSPHHLAGYLYGLSQTFNRFYEHSRVVGDEREAVRTQLVKRYHEVLVEGLGLLGIHVPERM